MSHNHELCQDMPQGIESWFGYCTGRNTTFQLDIQTKLTDMLRKTDQEGNGSDQLDLMKFLRKFVGVEEWTWSKMGMAAAVMRLCGYAVAHLPSRWRQQVYSDEQSWPPAKCEARLEELVPFRIVALQMRIWPGRGGFDCFTINGRLHWHT